MPVIMIKPASRNLLKHLRTSDVRGVAQLATQATAGMTRIVEGVHQSMWNAVGVRGKTPEQTGGITGLVYTSIYAVTKLLGTGIDTVLASLHPQLESAEESKPGSPEREAFLAALNGILGDHLLASNN